MELKKRKLLIITDLWGMESGSYLSQYIRLLKPYYEIEIIAARTLAGISPLGLSQSCIHNEFIDGGIDKAVEKLVESFDDKSVSILGFSIGGTIAWKAMLKGLKVEKLVAVSATRLRHESNTPGGKLFLYFGSEDNFIPDKKWFSETTALIKIYSDYGHELYKEGIHTWDIVEPLLQQE